MVQILRYLITLTTILSTWSMIIRLPCKMSANFTIFAEEHHFVGNVIATLLNLTSIKTCGLDCVTKYNTCSFFNFYQMENKCQLFNTSDGYIEKRVNATIYYAKTFEYCPGIWKEFYNCTATCSALGYVNDRLADIAVDKTYYSDSPVYGNSQLYLLSGAFDRNYATNWAPHVLNIAWMMIDFGEIASIQFVLIYSVPLNHRCVCHERLYNFNITIGNIKDFPETNPICVFNGNQVGFYKKWYDCLSGKMKGRYLYFGSDRTGLPQTILNMMEFLVF